MNTQHFVMVGSVRVNVKFDDMSRIVVMDVGACRKAAELQGSEPAKTRRLIEDGTFTVCVG